MPGMPTSPYYFPGSGQPFPGTAAPGGGMGGMAPGTGNGHGGAGAGAGTRGRRPGMGMAAAAFGTAAAPRGRGRSPQPLGRGDEPEHDRRPAPAGLGLGTGPDPAGAPAPPRNLPGLPSPRSTPALAPSVRAFKISENQSPRPQDRVFFSFNFFENVNQSVNKAFGSPVTNMRVYRYVWGVEKTFNNGMGSVGIRLPLNTLTADSTRPKQFSTPTSTSLNDLSVYAKYILCQNVKTGSLVSVGMLIAPRPARGDVRQQQVHPADPHERTCNRSWPTSTTSGEKFYVQGFSAYQTPVNPRDVMLAFNDVVFGYYLYQSQDPDRFLTGVVPVFEVHTNIPLNHRGVFSKLSNGQNDPSGTAEHRPT